MTYPMYARAAADLTIREVGRPDAHTIGEPVDLGSQWGFRWGVGDQPFMDSPLVLVDKESLEVSFG